MQIGNPLKRIGRPGSAPVDAESMSDLRQINYFVIPFIAVCVGTVLWYFGFSRDAGVALMWATASLTAGGGAGFLFGIPRSAPGSAAPADAGKAADGTRDGLRPNTNLEEVSDWLTKIIVGLGLVNLNEIGPGLKDVSAAAAAGWPGLPAAQGQSVAMAIVVAFSVTGFLASYVYTRLFLQGAIGRADQVLGTLRRTEAALATLPQPETDPDRPVALSAQELKVAETIRSSLRAEDLPAVVGKMRSLASEYEQIRQSEEGGPDRTQKMAHVVQQMRGLALAAMPSLPDFTRSDSPGERLAAVAMLQTRFDAAYIDWLARRLVEERPFIGFNAASALLTASKNLAGEPLRKLYAAVREARDELARLNLHESGRDGLIERILAQAPKTEPAPPDDGPR